MAFYELRQYKVRPGKMTEWLKARARSYGTMIGSFGNLLHGEGYVQREVMQVDDVVTLPVASI